ncbi:hypothetical protein IC614_11965 [Allosphingosinicella flava]|uniref:Uncharacterized protein n=1 Tax=Allosphingosinicella flava TaxID=2771430 RepID=A0A7T2GJF5_9SPHN|nr:hypothetical protein [Sphingosinicella flava]QPQ55002.1 hypothetical protein IC614_11965 [Sphingosinicella flava]
MFRPFLALLATAALPAAATSQTTSGAELWNASSQGDACMVTSSDSGSQTVLSIMAAPTDGAFIFLVQNPAWQSLEDGAAYPVAVEFDDFGPWQIQASARENIDADGPGLAFTVAPSREDGNGFIQEMVKASSMEIVANGATVGTLSVAGSEKAMQELARCMAKSWAGLSEDGAEVQAASDTPATPL